ncbi:MAG: restriction endonuclease subunit S [Psychrobacter celer]
MTDDLTQMDYPRYESYKDSGVDWLGEIPEEWNLLKVKNIFRLAVNYAEKNNGHELLSVYTEIGVKPRKELEERGNKASTTDGYLMVEKGDIVVNKLLAWMGAIGISNYDGVTSPAYDILKAYKPINGLFYHYLFRNPRFVSELKRHSRGIMNMRLRLYFDKFGDVLVPFPPLEIQNETVKFIESRATQIDQAIALKQQQIAKLEEYKQIVIQNAVTKGLNPNAPMKNSGVDRIDKLPEHWEVKKFRFSFKFQRGLNITKDDLRDKGVLCLNYGEIHSKYGFELLPEHKLKYVDDKYTETNHKSLLNNGDFVFADTSEDIAGSGNFSYINGMMQVFAGYHTLIAKPIIDFDSRFVAYLLDSRAFRGQVQQRVKGVKVYSITQSILKSTYIWLPPIDEQVKIVQELDLEMKLINETIQSYKTQINRLKEYKTILINQAVTGKIKIS